MSYLLASLSLIGSKHNLCAVGGDRMAAQSILWGQVTLVLDACMLSLDDSFFLTTRKGLGWSGFKMLGVIRCWIPLLKHCLFVRVDCYFHSLAIGSLS
jgi:hypothetical protein